MLLEGSNENNILPDEEGAIDLPGGIDILYKCKLKKYELVTGAGCGQSLLEASW